MKKTVRMAPSLTRDEDGRYHITNALHESLEHAKDCCSWAFVRWLIDTHAIEVEVE